MTRKIETLMGWIETRLERASYEYDKVKKILES